MSKTLENQAMLLKDDKKLTESKLLILMHTLKGTRPFRTCDLIVMMKLVRSEGMAAFGNLTKEEAKCFGIAPL